MRRTIPLLLLGLFYLTLEAEVARGHALDPAFLELVESGEGVEVTWRLPAARLPGLPAPTPELPCPVDRENGGTETAVTPSPAPLPAAGLPEEVVGVAVSTLSVDGRTLVHRWRLDCGLEGLTGRRIRIDGIGRQSAPVLVRWLGQQGDSHQRVLSAERASWTLPSRPSRGRIAWSYMGLGVEHILAGFDHLAFVFALMLWVVGPRSADTTGRRWRSLVFTLTAFTLGHSLTLALVVLDRLRLPSDWVEIAIAASILYMAVELASAPADRPTASKWADPWWLAGGFGLLHGCGFAEALRQTGLPRHEIPAALIAFNLGIELGQLLFVAVLGLLALVAGRALSGISARSASLRQVDATRAYGRFELLATHALGALAAYWTLGRLLGALG